MNTLIETQHYIDSQAIPFGTESCSLALLDKQILGQDILADRDYPPFNRAAMDGIGLRYKDWESGVSRYHIKKIVYAGDYVEDELGQGECFTITTGAACPNSVDAIIRKEDIVYRGQDVEVLCKSIRRFQNIAKKGEDCMAGDLIVPTGTHCNPSIIAVLAAVGKSFVPIVKMPRTAMVTTGSEVVDIEHSISPFQIRNSNSYLLKSMLKRWNIEPELNVHVKDSKKSLRATLSRALEFDLVLINGGISVGDADYVLEILQELNVEIIISQVAVRPGKPVTIGRTMRGTLVFALPGNPLSCMLTFILFVEYYLRVCSGLPEGRYNRAVINFRRENKSGLDEFFPIRINPNGSGLEIISNNGSGDITATLSASGFGWHPAGIRELHIGQQISYIPY